MARTLKDLVYASTGIDLGSAHIDVNTQLAVAGVMAVAALSDGSIDPRETERMVLALKRHYDLSNASALDFVTRAIEAAPGHEATPELLSSLNEELSLKQKEECLVMLLEVIAADGEKEAQEMKVLNDVIESLKIPERSVTAAFAEYHAGKRSS